MPRAAPPGVIVVDPLLSATEADALGVLWHDFGEYRTSSTRRPGPPRPAPAPQSPPPGRRIFRPSLAPRADAGRNFVRTGGRFGRTAEGPERLRARNDYFRETYADDGEVRTPGIQMLLDHEGLATAARALHGLAVVVPTTVYANVLLPGQELGLHTDVPQFRLTLDAPMPLWLRVVMRHSGLFERWRLPVATAVTYLGEGPGGAFAYYPEGSAGPVATLRPRARAAVVLDADTIFHGVDRVGPDGGPVPPTGTGLRLVHQGGGHWVVRGPAADGAAVRARYRTGELRFSVSWKAHCFADDEARRVWAEHGDDLAASAVAGLLETELVRRGRLPGGGHALRDDELGRLCIDEFIAFPAPEPRPAPAPT